MEIVVSPEHPAERPAHHAHQPRHATPCELDVTSYTELVLAPRAADVAHRAFSSMFVRDRGAAESGAALIATRRPRRARERSSLARPGAHPRAPSGFGELEFETSRAAFLGRGRSARTRPRALDADGAPDRHARAPCSIRPSRCAARCGSRPASARASRSRPRSAARASRRSSSRRRSRRRRASPRTFELAWADARVELRHSGIGGRAVASLPAPALGACFVPSRPPRAARCEALQRRGPARAVVAGIFRRPADLARCASTIRELSELCRELLLAHEFWRLNNVRRSSSCCSTRSPRLPAAGAGPDARAGHARHAQASSTSAAACSCAASSHLSQRSATCCSAAARVVLLRVAGLAGAPAAPRSRARGRARAGAAVEASRCAAARAPGERAAAAPASCSFDNGIGGFSADGREYVMAIGPGARRPRRGAT